MLAFAAMSSESDDRMDAMLKEGEGVIDDLVEMYVRVGLEAEGENWFESGRLAFEKALVLRPRDFDLWIQMAEMDAKYASNIQESIISLSAFAHAVEIDSERAKEFGIDANAIATRLLTRSNQIESKTERREIVRLARSIMISSSPVTKQQDIKAPPPPPLPHWYAPMLNDEKRNKAFANAIQSVVTSSTERVCDIGTGSGLLGILAAKSGAKEIIGFEIEPSLARVAEMNARRNNLDEERFRVITGHSSQIETFPQEKRCDVLVSEVLDDNLIGPSDWLGVLKHARKNLLAENTIVIPSSAMIYAVLIESNEIRDVYKLPNEIEGVRIDDLNSLWKVPETVHSTIQLAGLNDYRVLGHGEIELYRWDFQNDKIENEIERSIEIQDDDMVLDAIVVLWDADLVENVIVSNRPHLSNGEFMHWNNDSSTCSSSSSSSSSKDSWRATNHWSQEAVVFTNGGLRLSQGSCVMRIRHDSAHFYFDLSDCK